MILPLADLMVGDFSKCKTTLGVGGGEKKRKGGGDVGGGRGEDLFSMDGIDNKQYGHRIAIISDSYRIHDAHIHS